MRIETRPIVRGFGNLHFCPGSSSAVIASRTRRLASTIPLFRRSFRGLSMQGGSRGLFQARLAQACIIWKITARARAWQPWLVSSPACPSLRGELELVAPPDYPCMGARVRPVAGSCGSAAEEAQQTAEPRGGHSGPQPSKPRQSSSFG